MRNAHAAGVKVWGGSCPESPRPLSAGRIAEERVSEASIASGIIAVLDEFRGSKMNGAMKRAASRYSRREMAINKPIRPSTEIVGRKSSSEIPKINNERNESEF